MGASVPNRWGSCIPGPHRGSRGRRVPTTGGIARARGGRGTKVRKARRRRGRTSFRDAWCGGAWRYICTAGRNGFRDAWCGGTWRYISTDGGNGFPYAWCGGAWRYIRTAGGNGQSWTCIARAARPGPRGICDGCLCRSRRAGILASVCAREHAGRV